VSRKVSNPADVIGETLDSTRAWVTVAAGFLACFTVFGLAYSFGAFFKPMALEFGATREATSAIFSITASLYFLLGPLTGYLADRFGPQPVVGAGALITGGGVILTSFIPRLWFAYLTYGLGVGIGVSCCYVPLVTMIAGWFDRRRNTALGVAISGIGAGTLAIPPLAGELIVHLGWRRAYVILGAGAAALLLLCAALLLAGACTFTPPERPSTLRAPPPATVNRLTLDQYREAVARRIAGRNPSYVLKRSPQAMLRSLVVVAFTVDRNGALVSSSVYRTNGDDEAEATAIATLRRAAPLPAYRAAWTGSICCCATGSSIARVIPDIFARHSLSMALILESGHAGPRTSISEWRSRSSSQWRRKLGCGSFDAGPTCVICPQNRASGPIGTTVRP